MKQRTQRQINLLIGINGLLFLLCILIYNIPIYQESSVVQSTWQLFLNFGYTDILIQLIILLIPLLLTKIKHRFFYIIALICFQCLMFSYLMTYFTYFQQLGHILVYNFLGVILLNVLNIFSLIFLAIFDWNNNKLFNQFIINASTHTQILDLKKKLNEMSISKVDLFKIITKLNEERQVIGELNYQTFEFKIQNSLYLKDDNAINSWSQRKNQILGMIKAYGKININEAATILNVPEMTLKQILFEMLGENRINGIIANNEFNTEELDKFIAELEMQFSRWSESEINHYGKNNNTICQ